MGIVFPLKFTDGDTVSSEEFITKFNRIEKYLNGKISRSAVSYSLEEKLKQRWIRTHHIFKPEFYGSPDPRMVATSGTVHHRFSPVGRVQRSVHHGLTHVGSANYDRGTASTTTTIAKGRHTQGKWNRQRLWPAHSDPEAGQWQGIRGMAVTVFNDGGPLRSDGSGGQSRDIIVTGSCTAFEVGSFDPGTGSDVPESEWKKWVYGAQLDPPSYAHGPEKVECARVGLFIDGILEGTSVRRIFTSRGQKWVTKNFMWTHSFVADPGYHHIEFRLKVLERFYHTTDPPDRWWRIVVDSRSVVVDMQNFRETDTTDWPE